jgi:hypothetical protein
MIDGVVYKIFKDDNCYVGSTLDYDKRKKNHNERCNNENSKKYHYKIYQIIRDNGGWDTFNHEILESGEYEDTSKLLERERYFYELLKPNMNSRFPTRSKQEWYEDNKENNKEKTKLYYKENKNIIIERVKLWNKNNKEHKKEYDKIYREKNNEKLKEGQKNWYENNKERILEKAKVYREENKEIIKERRKKYSYNEKRKEEVKCEVCDCYITRSSLSRHKKTKKHINNLNQSTTINN